MKKGILITLSIILVLILLIGSFAYYFYNRKLDKIKLCVGYEYNGKKTMRFSTNNDYLKKCTPIYEEFDGNFGDISNITKREDLPENAKKYLNRIEEIVNVPIKFIGTGADRNNMIIV